MLGPAAPGAYTIAVNNSKPFAVSIGSVGLGIFQNYHLAASIRQNGSSLWYNNLATPGETLSIYATGGGPVISTQGTLSLTQTPAVSIDGQALPAGVVSFAGLAPGLQGLWQYNVVLPFSLASSSAHTITISVGGSSDSADILVGPGIGGVIVPTNCSLVATRAPVTLSGTVAAGNQSSPITGFGNYVAPVTLVNIHISVNGQGRYVNLEHDTTFSAIAANAVLKIPEIVVDDDAEFTFLDNHPMPQPPDLNGMAGFFWLAGTQAMNNHDFALYSNTIIQSTIPAPYNTIGNWNSWTYSNLPVMLWPSFPVQITNIDGAPEGQAMLSGLNTDLKVGLRAIIQAQTMNGQQVFTEVAQCDTSKPCVQFAYFTDTSATLLGEWILNKIDSNSNLLNVTVNLPNTTNSGWLGAARHELGHSMGLFYHSPSIKHVMYEYQMSVPALNLTPLEQSTLDFLYTLQANQLRFNIAETSVPADLSQALHVTTAGVVSK